MILKQEKQKYYHSMVGPNSPWVKIKVSILNIQFKCLTKWIEQKRERRKVLNLPIHPVLKEHNLKKVVIKISEFLYAMHTKQDGNIIMRPAINCKDSGVYS